jgi:PhzF family phenazine biosynthesis protein
LCGAAPSDYSEAMRYPDQRIVQVDAFTNRAFRGNPAAVCVLERAAGDDWLQAVAGEMNLSETAFLQRRADGFDLRWFTPTTEVPLCGHATLASAHVLWEEGELQSTEEARFHTKSGVLRAHRDGEWIAMDFPALATSPGSVPRAVVAALAVDPVFSGVTASGAHLVELGRAEDVRDLVPDLAALATASRFGTIVTARADDPAFDFVSRFFAPALGVAEDPVTGSAHCALGPYWASRLGKTELVGYQASARGGIVRVRTGGSDIDSGRLQLLGQAITVLRGTLAT